MALVGGARLVRSLRYRLRDSARCKGIWVRSNRVYRTRSCGIDRRIGNSRRGNCQSDSTLRSEKIEIIERNRYFDERRLSVLEVPCMRRKGLFTKKNCIFLKKKKIYSLKLLTDCLRYVIIILDIRYRFAFLS